MAKRAIKVDALDNVAVTLEDVEGGELVEVEGVGRLTAAEKIPFSHKIAIRDISRGERIIRYGEAIGVASRDIREGEWVHTHNLAVPDELLSM